MSTKQIDRSLSLGQVVLKFPEAAGIFNQYKIDYCCGGDQKLEEAVGDLKEAGVDTEKLLESLDKKYNEFLDRKEEIVDWTSKSSVEIIDHILETHHAYTKETLQDLDDMVNKILKVHFKTHSEELLKVHKLFGNLKVELEEHLIKEEERLFPMIEDYEHFDEEEVLSDIRVFIDETESEHDVAGDILKELSETTRDFNPPEGACTTFKRAYKTLDELEKDIFTHVHLENSVLFKRYE